MARPLKHAKAPVEIVQPPAVDEDPSNESSGFSEDDSLERVLAELGENSTQARVMVYEVSKQGPDAYLYECDPEQFSIPDLGSNYGSGTYRIKVRYFHPEHRKWVIGANRIIPIRLRLGAEPKAKQEPDTSALLVQTMTQGFQELGKLIAAQVQPQRSEAERMKETIQMLAMMREAIAPAAAPAQASPAVSPMQVLELAVDLAGRINPRENPPDGMEVLLEAVKGFAPILGQLSQAQPALPSPDPQPALPHQPGSPGGGITAGGAPRVVSAPSSPPRPNARPGAPSESESHMIPRPLVELILAQAKADNDPSTYAAMILDLAPAEKVAEFVGAADWWERLTALEPRAAQYREWFTELHGHLAQGLTLMEEGETISSDAARPGTDSDTDADPGGG